MNATAIPVFGPHRWERGPSGKEWVLIGNDTAEAEGRDIGPSASYRADEHPTLFRQFADLPPTRDAIAAFADRYGNLYLGEGGIGEMVPTFDEWVEQITLMRLVLGLWEAGQESTATVKRFFAKLETQRQKERRRPVLLAIGIIRHGYGMNGKVLLPANREQALATALSFVNYGLESMQPQLLLDGGHAALVLVPTRLRQVVWWQCAKHFTDGTQLRRCAHCGTWFTIRPPLSRKHRIYCSENCKVYAYRARKQEQQS